MGSGKKKKIPHLYAKRKETRVSCNKQFPDCPPEPNEQHCKTCPLYKK